MGNKANWKNRAAQSGKHLNSWDKGIIEADIIKQMDMKEKIRKENFIRTRKLL